MSRGAYYRSLTRGESARGRSNRELLEQITRIQKKVKYRYGSPRVTAELRREGRCGGHNRVARLMREAGLPPLPLTCWVLLVGLEPGSSATCASPQISQTIEEGPSFLV